MEELKITNKVRYERRVFYHELAQEDGMSIGQLVTPLAKICLDFGGFPGVESNLYDSAGRVRTNITYVVGKKNGAAAVVELEADLWGYRVAAITNVEKYEHQELLAALHKFYNGRKGYRGKPEPEIVERVIKTK